MKITDQIVKNRRAWLRALRSGDYKQGRDQLRCDGKYCCLGVACDISGIGQWESRYGIGDKYYVVGEEYSDCVLTSQLLEWLGMTGQGQNTAINLNDKSHFTFKQIAEHFKHIWRRI